MILVFKIRLSKMFILKILKINIIFYLHFYQVCSTFLIEKYKRLKIKGIYIFSGFTKNLQTFILPLFHLLNLFKSSIIIFHFS